MLFGWGGADGTGLTDGQDLIEEVVFERRAEGGESVNPTNTGSKNMKSSTNSTSKGPKARQGWSSSRNGKEARLWNSLVKGRAVGEGSER